MYVADQMTREIFAVAADTSLEAAARLLCDRGISGAPVVSEAGKPIGVITLSDLADPDRKLSQRDCSSRFYLLHGNDMDALGDTAELSAKRVDEAMSKNVLAIDSSAELQEAGLLLVEHGVHRLLVIDEEKLVGIISSLDVLRGILR